MAPAPPPVIKLGFVPEPVKAREGKRREAPKVVWGVNAPVRAGAFRGGRGRVILPGMAHPIQARPPEVIPPISLNGNRFGNSRTQLPLPFFKESKVKIGDREFVLSARGDGNMQEFEYRGWNYRFLIVGHGDNSRVISEIHAPKEFKAALAARDIPFVDPAPDPAFRGRTVLGVDF
ncbi:MAG: hypothetical protein HKN23_19570 [Verrucomicrobiales bacterium]|nr:hypothetical protein [Verrucomicrobiales bacterium]